MKYEDLANIADRLGGHIEDLDEQEIGDDTFHVLVILSQHEPAAQMSRCDPYEPENYGSREVYKSVQTYATCPAFTDFEPVDGMKEQQELGDMAVKQCLEEWL